MINGSNIDVTIGAADSSGSFDYTTTDGNGGTDTATVTVFHSSSATITGDTGNDILVGDSGNDSMDGDDGINVFQGGTGTDTVQFNAISDGVAIATNTAVTLDANLHNMVLDFTTGTDKLFLSSAFGFNGTLTENTNFFEISDSFTGTNSGVASGSTPYIVVEDSTGTVYYDDDSSTAGFTVLTESNGNAPVFGDFNVEPSG